MISRGRVDLSAVAAMSPHGWEEGSMEVWMEPIWCSAAPVAILGFWLDAETAARAAMPI
jgi:hypothetical protein